VWRAAARGAVLACSLALATPAAARLGDRAIVDLAGNSEFLRLATALEDEGLDERSSAGRVHALCYAYSRIKRYRRLLDCLDALDARIAKGDTETLLFALDDARPHALLLRAGALVDLVRYADGVRVAREALVAARAQSPVDRDIEMEALSTLVIASVAAGERKAAEEALAQLAKVPAGGNALGGRDLGTIRAIALGRAHLALGQYAEAIRAIEADRAFGFRASVDNFMSGASARGRNAWRWQELPRLFIVSHALYMLGRVDEAKARYDEMLAVPGVRDNGEILWNASFDRGMIAARQGDRAGAIGFFRRAIEAIEEQRSSISNETSKIGFLRDKQAPFDRIIALLFADGREEEVFDFIERAKSRALLDLLAGRLTFNEGVLPPADETLVATTPDRMQIDVTSLRSRRRSGAAPAASSATPLPEAVDPETDFGVLTLKAEELARSVPANEAVVQYYLAGDYVAISVLAGGRLHAVTQPSDTLVDDVRALYRLAADHKSDGKAIADLAQRVHARLIAPVAPHLQGRRITFVPHGPLHYVPFALLGPGGGAPALVDTHVVRVLPSASLVGLLRDDRPAGDRSLIVFGNPTLDLPGAEVEAKAVAAGTTEARVFLREAATRDAFVANASRHRRIHVAAHAKFHPDRPLDSALLFAPGGGSDGQLTVRDLYRLRLDADLVVLSACETGMSAVHKGDELVGLIRGFLYGGARSIVATLWEIEDDSAVLFATTFYAAAARMDKAAALREAALAVKRKFPHPLYWAPFVITGGV